MDLNKAIVVPLSPPVGFPPAVRHEVDGHSIHMGLESLLDSHDKEINRKEVEIINGP